MYKFKILLLNSLFFFQSPFQVELGKTLFFDPRLSGDNTISCASCHIPEKGWSDGLATAVGFNGKILARKTPTVAYLEDDRIFFWDGRATSLEEQALGPITSVDEMNQNLNELVNELEDVPAYRAMFARAFPGEKISAENIALAISNFERSLNRRNSEFDKWSRGEPNTMSSDAKLGHSRMHTWEANCISCHRGADFNDDGMWDVGVFSVEPGAGGKFIFKTPTLRDVALRAPFMHNGSLKTLEDVVRFYARGGDVPRPTRAPPMRAKIELSEHEIYQVVEFLKTLTTDNSDFKRPEIP